MSTKTRVIVIVNKYWECDPVCWVLTNKYINDQCNLDLDVVNSLNLITYPSYGPVKPGINGTIPRMVFEMENRNIEVWCISDLLGNSPDDKQSSSEEKMKFLPEIYKYQYNGQELDIELVIAVGTASAGPSIELNPFFKSDNITGSVIVGSNVFMHNSYSPGSKSDFKCDCWGEIMGSGSNKFIRKLQNVDFKDKEPIHPFSLRVHNYAIENYVASVDFKDKEQLLLCPSTNPSPLGQHIYVNENYIALGSVNVTEYTKYAEEDKKTGNYFFAQYPGDIDGASLETTHCLIYLAAKNYLEQDPPFMFVSGIVDRYVGFDEDVGPKTYAQNVSGAHNAGVAVAHIISKLTGN
ncbi:hypothetical protein [Methanococcus maripaludis]|uniref:Uncharacterized protein n=1 Tax=Methanococcus maripaludis TaxID=39152 RepID=A0A7J9PHM9_METMI|nr:hypothetical protein [Methanococcus maripaludis]MBA2861029.1 hypothetical protein [Methanococcus maripaludis]